jgi:hypothetical protein
MGIKKYIAIICNNHFLNFEERPEQQQMLIQSEIKDFLNEMTFENGMH